MLPVLFPLSIVVPDVFAHLRMAHPAQGFLIDSVDNVLCQLRLLTLFLWGTSLALLLIDTTLVSPVE